MRNDFDCAPLYRSSIGFDRVFNLLTSAQQRLPEAPLLNGRTTTITFGRTYRSDT